MTLHDALTDAIATEDRREWLSPDEVAEMVDDVLRVLRGVDIRQVLTRRGK